MNTTAFFKHAVRGSILTLSIVAVLGCASPRPVDYAAERPRLDLREYFDGELDAHGVATDRAGKVLRRFTVRMTGRWAGQQGVLEEDFLYSDGKTERRVWHLVRGDDGRYIGRAADVVADARGEASGNALNWQYTLRVPVDGSVYEVEFDDWMFLVDEKVLLNRATMSKFGIRMGEVLLSFRKR